jgi:Fe-S-cluster containining protein
MLRKKTDKNYYIREVPCNGCILCCKGDAVRLQDEDDPSEYITSPHPFFKESLMIAHKENGDCIYLNNDGCSIHHRAPSLCRTADCRTIALKIDFARARQLHHSGLLDLKVWDKGHELLNQLKKETVSK